ncbi:MAG TPA: sporulation integral membrane protein YtvI [Symbiobacteriaceae bacterium]|jgi:sporulation integral membrane protein YtvI
MSVLGLIGFLVGSFLLIQYGLPLVMPFVMALLIAELIDPLVGWLNKKARLPRSIAVSVVLLLFVGLITTAVTAAIARLVQEIAGIIDQMPYLYAIGMDLGTRFAEQFGAFHASLPASVQKMLAEALTDLQSSLSAALPMLKTTLGSIGSLPMFMTNTLIWIVATFFISRDRREIAEFMLKLFPAPWRPKLQKVKAQVWTSAMGWAKAQLMLITMSMILSMIGLSLIGAQYSVLIGILVAVFDILPLLGTATVFLPWAAYCFLFGTTIFGVKLLVVYAVVAGIRQVLEPKLVGEQLGLHPLAILLSIYLGFVFFGALGFIVGPLLAILLKALLQSGLLPQFQD